MGNAYTCEPGQHDFSEMFRPQYTDGSIEPARLFCHKCAWVRDIPAIEPVLRDQRRPAPLPPPNPSLFPPSE